jgi:murein DD-endopeptidase MepM/ murein hydrolase activator NlpD
MKRDKLNLVLLDEDGFSRRNLTLSPAALRFFGGLLVAVLVFSSVMTWGFLYYRNKNHQTTDASMAVLQHERARLISKIGALEGTIQRIEKFTEKLEASVGVESGKLNMGVGPLSEQEDLGEFLSRVHKLPKLSSKALQRDFRQGKFDEDFNEKLSFKLDELYEFAANLEVRVNEVYESNEDSLSFWASSPSLWPVKGWLTSGFGYRYSPWGGDVRMHKGIDIAAPYGSDIFAPSDGVVIFSGGKGGYGQAVIVDHGFGIKTLYGHNSQLFVAEGDMIKRGQKLASVGSSGSSTGPHLHYEIHVDGIPTDPMNYILQ